MSRLEKRPRYSCQVRPRAELIRWKTLEPLFPATVAAKCSWPAGGGAAGPQLGVQPPSLLGARMVLPGDKQLAAGGCRRRTSRRRSRPRPSGSMAVERRGPPVFGVNMARSLQHASLYLRQTPFYHRWPHGRPGGIAMRYGGHGNTAAEQVRGDVGGAPLARGGCAMTVGSGDAASTRGALPLGDHHGRRRMA